MARVVLILASTFSLAAGKSNDVGPGAFNSSVTRQVNCAFDVTGILLAAGKTGKAFYSVQKSCRKQETAKQKRSCAAAVQRLVASVGFIASFSSGAANDCAASLNVPAVCSGASSTFVAVLAIMGGAFANFKTACLEDDDDGDDVPFRRLRGHSEAYQALSPANSSAHFTLAQLPPSPARVLDADLEKRIKDSLADKQKRQADITSCVLDVGLAALFSGRGLMNIAKAAQHSPCVERFESHPGEAETACAVQVSGIIATFEFVGSLLSAVAALCPIERRKPKKAKCAADSLVVMAGVGALIQEGAAISLECGEPDPENEEHINEDLEGDIIP